MNMNNLCLCVFQAGMCKTTYFQNRLIGTLPSQFIGLKDALYN